MGFEWVGTRRKDRICQVNKKFVVSRTLHCSREDSAAVIFEFRRAKLRGYIYIYIGCRGRDILQC